MLVSKTTQLGIEVYEVIDNAGNVIGTFFSEQAAMHRIKYLVACEVGLEYLSAEAIEELKEPK